MSKKKIDIFKDEDLTQYRKIVIDKPAYRSKTVIYLFVSMIFGVLIALTIMMIIYFFV